MYKNNLLILFTISLVLLVLGCGPRIMVPPAIDLTAYEPVGIINFACNAEGKLDRYITQRFIEEMTKDQKLIKIIELGKEEDVLKAVNRVTLGPDVVKEIAQKYNVKSVITGELNISGVRPKINIVPGLHGIGAEAEVEATLVAHMLETIDGATIWTGSSRSKRTVGNVSFWSGGHFSFDAEDPEASYGDLAQELIHNATRDFRVTWHR